MIKTIHKADIVGLHNKTNEKVTVNPTTYIDNRRIKRVRHVNLSRKEAITTKETNNGIDEKYLESFIAYTLIDDTVKTETTPTIKNNPEIEIKPKIIDNLKTGEIKGNKSNFESRMQIDMKNLDYNIEEAIEKANISL